MNQIETSKFNILIIGLICALSFGCAPQVLEQSEALRSKHEKTTSAPKGQSDDSKPSSAEGVATEAVEKAEEKDAAERGRSGMPSEESADRFMEAQVNEERLAPTVEPTVTKDWNVEAQSNDEDDTAGDVENFENLEEPGQEPEVSEGAKEGNVSQQEAAASEEDKEVQANNAEAERQKSIKALVVAALENDAENFLKHWDGLTAEEKTDLANDVGDEGNTLLHLVTDVAMSARSTDQDDARIVQALCPLSKEIDRLNDRGRSPLQNAVQTRTQNGQMARALIECGANVNLATGKDDAIAPIILITYLLDSELFALAMEHGADLRIRYSTKDSLVNYPQGFSLANFASDGINKERKKVISEQNSKKRLAEKEEAYALIMAALSNVGVSIVEPLKNNAVVTATFPVVLKSGVFLKVDLEAQKAKLLSQKNGPEIDSAKKAVEEKALKECQRLGYLRCEILSAEVDGVLKEIAVTNETLQLEYHLSVKGRVKGINKE